MGAAVPVVSIVARPNLYGVSCWDAEDCVAVGVAAGSGHNLYLTNNNGLTWNSEASGVDSALLKGVNCSVGFCLAAGYLGELVTNCAFLRYPFDTFRSSRTLHIRKEVKLNVRSAAASANGSAARERSRA